MQKHDIVANRIFTIENFLSPQECAQQVLAAEALGFDAASVATKSGPQLRPDIRNNARVVFDDEPLAQTFTCSASYEAFSAMV